MSLIPNFRASIISLVATVLLIGSLFPADASAVSASDWRAGSIIDDAVFTSKSSMSVSSIQSWLDTRLKNCDYWGTQPSEWGGTDYDGNGTVTRAEYGRLKNNPAPFTCLNKYYEVPKTSPGPSLPASNYGKSTKPSGSKSAAQLIYDAAQAYNISPKVLLVKLGTESPGPLTSDTWPFKNQYLYAMGAHCPDSGPGGSANCDSDYAGFSLQMREAAKLLRWYLDNMTASWWSYKKPYASNYILWNVQPSGCGGKNVYINNKATAALYTYTPYQPNSAALNNLYGTGDNCSAYGNRNFWRVYNDWFGPSRELPRYTWSIVKQETYTDSARTQKISNFSNLRQGSTYYLKVVARNTGNQVWTNDTVRLGASNPRDRKSPLRDNSWVNTTRAAVHSETSVAPGQTATYRFSVTAPDTLPIGVYKEYYSLVAEHITWLNSPGMYYNFTVTPGDPIYDIRLKSANFYRDRYYKKEVSDNVRVVPGQKLYAKVSYQNIGNMDLTSSFMKVGTYAPRDRSSIFQNSTWAGSTRPTAQSETKVAPTKYGTLRFSITAPSTLGSYDEGFAIVADGRTWFDSTAFSIQPEVVAQPASLLLESQFVSTWQQLESNSNIYRFVNQDDGNLVLRNANNKVVWKSNTENNPGAKLRLQNDGNLVLRNKNGAVVWKTDTQGNPGAYAVLQDDGNVVIRSEAGKALWASDTVNF